MSRRLRLKKTIISFILPALMSGCAPFIPDNYLAPGMIKTPQKIDGKWVEPTLVPISTNLLNTPKGRELLSNAMQPQPYRVGSFDSLNIIVWGHPELSTVGTSSSPAPNVLTLSSLERIDAANAAASNPAVLVQPDGSIYYPYVGHLQVAGLTINEIQDRIAARLSKYIRNPQVSIQVAKYRNRDAYVLGEVKAPGLQPLTDKPLTLMEAISSAGGINTGIADPTHIYIIRGSYEKPLIFWLNAQSPQSLMIAEHFPLQENDIVYVSAASLSSWNSFVNQILPNVSTYYTIRGLS